MCADPHRDLLPSAVFDGISDSASEALWAKGQVVSHPADTTLFNRGEDASSLMILQDGVVELLFPLRILGVTREVTMESKQPGSVVAWSALIDPYHFTLSARCASKCELISFSRNDLHSFFESDPRTGYLFMRNLAGVIGRRLQAMQTMWTHDLQASAAKRLE